jgi:hypothetical protein
MIEVGVVIAKDGNPLHWHQPPGRTGGSIPDTRELWDVIWENRDIIQGFAHSHPGSGVPGPSHTDVTTFRAIEKALGKALDWWITSSDTLIVVNWRIGRYEWRVLKEEPDWAPELRSRSA